eukprot:2074661-Amphidinium_carterae.1
MKSNLKLWEKASKGKTQALIHGGKVSMQALSGRKDPFSSACRKKQHTAIWRGATEWNRSYNSNKNKNI